MSPQKQAAQIANAQLSHGPSTPQGKWLSSQNSTRHSLTSKKHFILPEDRAEFNQHYDSMLAALAPEGAIESQLAEEIVIDQWRLTRAHDLENQIFIKSQINAEDRSLSGADTWLAHAKEFALLTLYEQRINRALTRNKAEFEAKQAARKALEVTERKPETAAPQPTGGFVHSSSVASLPVCADGLTKTPSQTPEPVPIPSAGTRRAA